MVNAHKIGGCPECTITSMKNFKKEIQSPPHKPVRWLVSYGRSGVSIVAQTAYHAYQKAYPHLPYIKACIKPSFTQVTLEITNENPTELFGLNKF